MRFLFLKKNVQIKLNLFEKFSDRELLENCNLRLTFSEKKSSYFLYNKVRFIVSSWSLFVRGEVFFLGGNTLIVIKPKPIYSYIFLIFLLLMLSISVFSLIKTGFISENIFVLWGILILFFPVNFYQGAREMNKSITRVMDTVSS